MAPRELEGLESDLERQRAHVAGRSPVYERALALLPGVLRGAPGRFVATAWERRTFFAWYDRPLLLLAALRDRALADGALHPLGRAFSDEGDPAAVTAEALEAALDGSRMEVFESLARRAVQTNETSRAVAWLWPAAILRAAAGDAPLALALADVGASAGLNLVADALPAPWTFRDGSEVPVLRGLVAAARLGLDAAPLDVGREDDARWLRACVWPGEAARLARLDAALEALRAARTRPDAPVLVPVSARSVPARLDLLSAADPGTTVLAFQTVMRDYLAPAERDEYEHGMRAWLGAHPPGRALWAELEAAPGSAGPGEPAAVTVHLRAPGDGVEDVLLARCGWHPLRLEAMPGAVARLEALLRASAGASASGGYITRPPSTSTQRPLK